MLIYHSGIGGKSKLIASAIMVVSIPFFLLMMRLDENRTLQVTIFIPLLVIGLLGFWFFVSLEYISQKNDT